MKSIAIAFLATVVVAQAAALVFPPEETAALIRNAIEPPAVELPTVPPTQTYAGRSDGDQDGRTHATGW